MPFRGETTGQWCMRLADAGTACTLDYMWPRCANGTRRGRILRVAVALFATGLLAGAAAPAQAASLQYFGGPIMHANTTVLVDWGSGVASSYTSGDPGFLGSLAGQIGSPGNVTGILAQYLDTSGQNY